MLAVRPVCKSHTGHMPVQESVASSSLTLEVAEHQTRSAYAIHY